ncbi:MAG TPA: hypothetical protein VIQ31_02830 [Phormidium sp.]
MKLRIISDSDSFYLGTIEAVVGMELKDGRVIVKVNPKSIQVIQPLVFGTQTEIVKITEDSIWEETSIWYTEMLKWGYPQLELEQHQVQIEARNERHFSEGEWWFFRVRDCKDYEIEKELTQVVETILKNPIKKAGYEFASATYTLRKLVLDNFK